MSIHLHRPMRPIVNCLVLLPNLHTLEVTTVVHGRPIVKSAFKSTRLPQVRTLVVDADAHRVIRCCENVKHVVIHRYTKRHFRYVKSIAEVKHSLTRVALCATPPLVLEGMWVAPRCVFLV